MNGVRDGGRGLPLALPLDSTHTVHQLAAEAEIRLNGRTPDPVPSRHGPYAVAEVTTDPGSFQYGPPPERRSAARARAKRPFLPLLDAWLERGGWAAGREGAGSVVLVTDTPQERRRLINRWRYEIVECRGWTAEHVTTRFVVAVDVTRFYWWTRPEWARRHPPEEEACLPEDTLEALGVEDDDDGD